MEYKARKFFIGELVYDDEFNEWGYISLINADCKDGSTEKDEDEDDFVFTLQDVPYGEVPNSEWEQNPRNLYQIAEGESFNNEVVCYEHHETEDNYPFYCPQLQENCFDFECVKTERKIITELEEDDYGELFLNVYFE